MNVDSDIAGDGVERARIDTIDGSGRPPIVLRLATVVRADGPDESTIYPPDAEGMDRMTTWITARDADVIDLLDAR